MLRRWTVAMMALLVGPVAAAEVSLLDPRVSVEAKGTPLSDVLGQLSRQSGVQFEGLFRAGGPRRDGAEPGPEGMPAQVRERFNPPVTLTVKDLPLREVLAKLEALTGFGFQARERGAALTVMPVRDPRATVADPPPAVTTEGYQIALQSVRSERVRERYWGDGARQNARNGLTVTLGVDAGTNLALAAVLGLAGDTQAVLDGETMGLVQFGNEPAELIASVPTGPGREGYALTFQLPEEDPARLTLLQGHLVVIDGTREHVFEFEDLETPNQEQSEDQVDVTLQQWRPGNEGPNDRPRGPNGERRDVAGTVDVAVSLPVTRTIQQRFRMLQQRLPWLRGVGGGLELFLGERPAAPPNAGGRALAGAAVGVQVEGRPPAGEGRPAAAEPGRGPGGAPPQVGDWLFQSLGRVGGGLEHLLPRVAVRRADGALANGRVRGLRDLKLAEDRASFILSVEVPAAEQAPQQLLVSVLEYGQETRRLPFMFADVALPTAAEAAR